MGIIGFDSRLNRYVSTPSTAETLVNIVCKIITGNYNVALAA